MQLPRTSLLFLGLQLLTTSVSADWTPGVRTLLDNSNLHGFPKSIGETAIKFTRRRSSPSNSAGRRRLDRRDLKDVPMGGWDYGTEDHSLITNYLADYMGIAVTCAYKKHKSSNKDKFLVHVYRQDRTTYDPFNRAVRRAIDKGCEIDGVHSVYTNPESTDTSAHFTDRPDKRLAYKADQLDFNTRLFRNLQALVENTYIQLTAHHIDTAYSLFIDDDKEITAYTT